MKQINLFMIAMIAPCVTHGRIMGMQGEMPDPCHPTESTIQIIDATKPCDAQATKADSCIDLAHCLARQLVTLAECDANQSKLECNKATAAFVIVEEFRRALSASRQKECNRAKRLKVFAAACVDGSDMLVRHMSVIMGGMESISDEMDTLAKRRLFQGTLSIILSFSLPGLLALVSLSHVRIVISLQLIALAMIFFYVQSHYGFLYASMVTGACALVMVAEVVLIGFVAKRQEQAQNATAIQTNHRD